MPQPTRIRWSEITPHIPPMWKPIGHPYPVPDGALFVVRQPARVEKGAIFAVLFIDSENKLHNVPRALRDTSTFIRSRDARDAIWRTAELLNAQPDVEDVPDEPGFLDHTDMVAEHMIEDAEQERMA